MFTGDIIIRCVLTIMKASENVLICKWCNGIVIFRYDETYICNTVCTAYNTTMNIIRIEIKISLKKTLKWKMQLGSTYSKKQIQTLDKNIYLSKTLKRRKL